LFDNKIKGVVHLKKINNNLIIINNLLIIYSPQCHPRSFLSRKEIKVFDGNISGFSPYNGLNGSQTVQGPNKLNIGL